VGDAAVPESFECTTERDDWQQCSANKIEYCHIVDGMDPHFHWGQDCDALGFECVETTGETAVCVDSSTSCEVGEFECTDNIAYNCIDGAFAVLPCGTANECHEEADAAECHPYEEVECGGHGHLDTGTCICDPGYAPDADDDLICVVSPAGVCTLFEGETHTASLVTVFSEVFAADYHSPLGELTEVTLPDNAESFIHFPVPSDGDYVIFLSAAGVLDEVLHRDPAHEVILKSGGDPNGECESTITEHWHTHLHHDSDAEDAVPYVLRFKAAAPQTLTFMILAQ
ncbi:hypothetical protein KAI87_08975, partial [Myxococcota bacterium]|nr:hypothetical protein [Myxococcota bacterium]